MLAIVRRYGPAVAVGLIGAWIGIAAWSGRTTDMGPFDVRLTTSVSSGGTTIGLPPLGEVRADTHTSPLRFNATLRDVNIERLGRILESRSTEQIVAQVEADARSFLLPYALWLSFVGLAGAAGLGVLAFRRRYHLVAVAALAGTVAVAASLGAARVTFRPHAFEAPRFTGSLALAPQLVGPVREITGRIEAFRDNLERIVDGAVRAYTAVEPRTLAEAEDVRVLHVSDIHLSPLGFSFALQVARGFDVDLVVDTGDLTSFGTPLEEAILAQVPAFGVPYLFVRGNHDTLELQRALEALPNGVALDGDTTEVAELTVYGLGHPAFTEDAEEELEQEEFVDAARAAGRRVLADVAALPRPPDVVAVHDDRMAQAVAGRVPLVISGHYHRASTEVVDGTLMLRAGTTGGAGINVFRRAGGVPLSAQILYFERGANPRLVAYDTIEQTPGTGRLVVDRHLVSDILEAPEPTPTPVMRRTGPR